ncbi:thioesterase family protein-like protein, partial [Saccharata proteae CBS 121410]
GRSKAMRAVGAMFERYKLLASMRPDNHVDFDHEVMDALKLVDAGPEGFAQFEMTISETFSNMNNVMHGGAAGVIFDMASTSALCPVSRPGFYYFMGGVSRTINISYLRAVPIGTRVLLSSRVTQLGRTMAMIRGEMTSLDGKIIYATVEHHKVNTPLRAGHLDARVPYDDEIEAE